jgi:hypothetical protein
MLLEQKCIQSFFLVISNMNLTTGHIKDTNLDYLMSNLNQTERQTLSDDIAAFFQIVCLSKENSMFASLRAGHNQGRNYVYK